MNDYVNRKVHNYDRIHLLTYEIQEFSLYVNRVCTGQSSDSECAQPWPFSDWLTIFCLAVFTDLFTNSIRM